MVMACENAARVPSARSVVSAQLYRAPTSWNAAQ